MGGSFTQVGSATRLYFAAITDGANQPTALQADANSTVWTLTASGNNLYVGGFYTQIQGVNTNYLSRINLSTGLVDNSWISGLNSYVIAIAVNGTNVISGGYFSFNSLAARNHIACIDLTTNQLTLWNPTASISAVYTINKILHYGSDVFIGGSFYYSDGANSLYGIMALNDATGDVSHSFTQYPLNTVTSLAVYDGKLTLGGYFYQFYDLNSSNYITRNYLAAYNLSDFQLSPIDYSSYSYVYDVVSDGTNMVACGDFVQMGTVHRAYLAALDATTGAVTSFNPNANNTVRVLASNGGILYAGGDFTNIGGQDRIYLAALNETDGTATSWNADCNAGVYALALSGTNLYVGGYFSTIKTVARNFVGSVSTTGTGTVTTWQPNPNSVVEDILPAGSDVYLAGYFTTVKGTARNYLAKVNNTNGNLNSWNPNPDSYCWSLAMNATTLFVSGSFENISGQSRSSIAAYDLTTNNLTSLHPVILPSYQGVYDMTLWGNSMYFSSNSSFMNVNGTDRGRVAAIDVTSGNLLPYDPNPTDGGVWSVQAGVNRLLACGDWTTSYDGSFHSPYFAVSTLSPLTQSSSLTFSPVTPTSIQANFTVGSGERRIVVVKQGSAVSNLPVNGQSYSANAAFQSGSNLGNGCYVVYDGTGSSVNVTNLLPNHTYYFAVLEQNGSLDYTAYLSPALTGNRQTPCNTFSPTVTPTGSTTFCAGGSVTLAAQSGFSSYLWNTSATSQNIIVSTSGNYTVTATDANGCSGTSAATSVTVNSNPTPTITPNGSTTFCSGGSVTLTATAGFTSYHWSTGATTQSITVNSSGNFTVTVTNNSGCSGTSPAVTVTVTALPTATITPAGPTTFCDGSNVKLNANSGTGLTYQWQLNSGNISGATKKTYTAKDAGNYTVTVSNNGCSAVSAPVAVTVNASPTSKITNTSPINICAGQTATLNAKTCVSCTYQWQKNSVNIPAATASSYGATAAGSYTVITTNTNGCSKTSKACVVNISCKGESMEQEESVSVYPNPASDNITIAVYAATGNLHFCLSDITGRILQEQELSSVSGDVKVEFNVSSYPSGNYFVRIVSGEKTIVRQIQIVK